MGNNRAYFVLFFEFELKSDCTGGGGGGGGGIVVCLAFVLAFAVFGPFFDAGAVDVANGGDGSGDGGGVCLAFDETFAFVFAVFG